MQLYEQIEKEYKQQHFYDKLVSARLDGEVKSFLKQSFIKFLEGECERLETIRVNFGTGINAIPTSDDYAKGWNHCRQEAFDKREAFLLDTISHYQNMIKELHGK